MCGRCGNYRKPACDQDPECPYHCFGDEHDDTLMEREVWLIRDVARVQLSALVTFGQVVLGEIDLDATTTPSNMSRGAELEMAGEAGEARQLPDTIGSRRAMWSRSSGR